MARNQIKGLTVEIGGDTTKLGKALESVNKKSSDLSGELKEINRMLKFDPGNADLLAQKQKVLAEAVENTSEKLKTLKKAEAQVQKQFEKGEVSEEQVRALQREIVATEGQLKSYQKEAKKAGKGLEELADKSDKAGKSSEGMGKKLANAAKTGLKVVAGLGTAVVGAMTGAAEATREYRGEMGKLEAAYTSSGHSTDTATKAYKTLQGVIGETDQSVEAAQQIALLADSEKDVAQWSDLAAGVVGKFGDALQPETFFEAANETLKLGESTGAYTQMLEGCGLSVEEFNAGLAACSTEAEKQAYMLEVTEGALGVAGEAYKKNNAEVIRANEANEAWMASMAEVGGAVEPILTDIKMMGASLLTEFVPGVKAAADALRGVLNGEDGAASALGDALGGIITQLLNKVVELAPTLVNVAMSLITSLTTTLISMLPQLVNTGVEVIMAILNGLTQAIPQIIQAIVQMIPQLVQALVNGIPQLIQGAVQLFLAILQAIPQLIPPLVAALPQIVMAVINGLLAAIPQLLDGAVQFLLAIVQAIPQIINALMPEIPKIITTIIDGLIENIPALLDGALQLLQAIVDAIPLLIDALIPQIPTIVNTIVQKLTQMTPVLFSAAVKLFWALIKAIPQIVSALLKNLPQILQAIKSVLNAIPQLLWNIFTKALGKVVQWGASLVTKGRAAVQKLVTAVVNKVKELPEKMKSAGKNLVQGLWKGINGAYTWLKNKIKGWVGNVTKFIQKLFGINSPSKKTEWMGEMLDAGFAEGIEGAEDKPLNAMRRLSEGMLDETDSLNGLSLERRIKNTFSDPGVHTAESGMLEKLDKILAAIERGQVLTLDGKALIGSTVGGYDAAMGQRRALAARGAL